MSDHDLAARLATEAGALLLELRARRVESEDFKGMKDEGDAEANTFLLERLSRERPDDAVLSEESADDLSRLDERRVWIVDPLDGTREYGEPPRTDWAVHVALVENGVPTVGAVALPALGVTLSTGDPPALPPLPTSTPRVIVSRTRPPAAALHLTEVLGGELVEMGSAGAKAMAVVRGEADVYAHSGGQYEWDSAAPVAVALAVGLHATRLDGTGITYNNRNPYLPDLLICRPELADAALAALESFEP